MSTLRQGRAAAGWERDHRRSVGRLPGRPPLGRQRRSAGLSQKIFVKRYQWLFGTRAAPCRIPMNRLTKRFIFISPTGRVFPELK